MTTPPPSAAHRHPLEDDPDRLEQIVDVMWLQIHKTIHRAPPPRRRTGAGAARVIGSPVFEIRLEGGVSTEDILSECLKALMRLSDGDVTQSWEAISVGIAINKTKGALRDSRAWLHATDNRPELTVVSGDAPGPDSSEGEPGPTIFDTQEATGPDLEEQFFATAQQIEIFKLAQELLDDRDRAIFLGLQTGKQTRQSLADEFDLTIPGVVHIWKQSAKKIQAHPRFQLYAEGGQK